MGCVGISGGYIPINWDAMKSEGTSKDFVGVAAEFLTSRVGGWVLLDSFQYYAY